MRIAQGRVRHPALSIVSACSGIAGVRADFHPQLDNLVTQPWSTSCESTSTEDHGRPLQALAIPGAGRMPRGCRMLDTTRPMGVRDSPHLGQMTQPTCSLRAAAEFLQAVTQRVATRCRVAEPPWFGFGRIAHRSLDHGLFPLREATPCGRQRGAPASASAAPRRGRASEREVLHLQRRTATPQHARSSRGDSRTLRATDTPGAARAPVH